MGLTLALSRVSMEQGMLQKCVSRWREVAVVVSVERQLDLFGAAPARRLRGSLDTAERLWAKDQGLQNLHVLFWAWRATAASSALDAVRVSVGDETAAKATTERRTAELEAQVRRRRLGEN